MKPHEDVSITIELEDPSKETPQEMRMRIKDIFEFMGVSKEDVRKIAEANGLLTKFNEVYGEDDPA